MGKFETNKWEIKEEVKKGGWEVAEGRELTETDAIQGVVAAGVSIYSGNSAPFVAWLTKLLNESLNKLSGNIQSQFTEVAKKQALDLARTTIKDLMSGQPKSGEALVQLGNIQFKVGVSHYIGKNREWIINLSKEGGYWQTISTTHAYQPYVAMRFKAFGVQDDTPASPSLLKLDAALLHPNGKAYFFRGDKYHRFNFQSDMVDKTGTIGVDGWKGVGHPIAAALLHPTNGKAYFFRGTKYRVFDFKEEKVVREAEIGVGGWKGVTHPIDAALVHPNGKAYFFRGNKYYRFDFNEEKVDKIGTISVDGWKGL